VPGRSPVDPALTAWLAERGFPPQGPLVPLAGDVSARRYLRVPLRSEAEADVAGGAVPGAGRDAGPSAVLALYPADLPSACRRFLSSGELLAAAGVRVPRVLAVDCDAGRMLVEDLGPQTLDVWAAGRPWSEVTPRFRAALTAARRIAALPAGAVAALSPPLDAALLRRELELTGEHFLRPRGLLADAALARRLDAALDDLVAALAAPPAVPCHRDFMVRNLVPVKAGGVAVLDHQDLRLGPPRYDLASLLNDTLFPPRQVEEALLAEHGVGEEGTAARTDYHRAAAQRTLKAVGSYAMAAAAGKGRHLGRIPATLGRALDHLAAIPETSAVAAPLGERWRVARGAAAEDLLH